MTITFCVRIILLVGLLAAPAAAQTLRVVSNEGTPGSRVQFYVALNDQPVVGAQTDIAFDANTRIPANSSGKPDCWPSSSLSKGGGGFEFYPLGCTGTACTQVRAVIMSQSNVVYISPGDVLFTCNVDISPSAPDGNYPLILSGLMTTDHQGRRLVTNKVDGGISVKSGVGC